MMSVISLLMCSLTGYAIGVLTATLLVIQIRSKNKK